MKILQLGKFYPIRGGVEKLEYDLCEGISERGIRCDMLCASAGCEQPVVRLNENSSVYVCRSWFTMLSTKISPDMIVQLRKMAANYDIIHIHHPDPMAGLALRLSGYKGKVVLHWHSDILAQKRALVFYRPLQEWLIKRADVIIGTSPKYISESSDLENGRNKCVAIPLGTIPATPVGEDEIKAFRDQIGAKKIIFSLGRLVEYKGFKHLIEAFKYLPEDYKCIIGGEGPLEQSLKQMVWDQKMTDRIIFTGRIESDKLPLYYASCDAFCVSSIWKTEAFAWVLIEAMSYGKPCVATKIPGSGVSWVNADGVSGINVNTEDAEDLARGILTVFESDNYAKFAQNAYERYCSLFTREGMVDSCLKEYEKLLTEDI